MLSNVLGFRGYDWVRLTLLALAYAMMARLLLIFSTANGNVTILWAPGGLALALLLVWGRRFWPGIFLGAWFAGLLAGDSYLLSGLIAIGNTLESLIAARLLQGSMFFNHALEHPRDFLLLFLAGCAAALVSALIGPFSLWAVGYLTDASLASSILRWWQADLLGIVLGAPVFLLWRNPPLDWLGKSRFLEALAFFGAAFLIGQIAFLDWFHGQLPFLVQEHLLVLLVVIAAVRFQRHGVLLMTVMTTIQALLGAKQGIGLFGTDFNDTQLQNFWFFELVLTVTGLALALTLRAQDRVTEQLRISDARYEASQRYGHICVWENDLLNDKQYWSSTAAQLLGFPEVEEPDWQAFLSMVVPEDRSRIIEAHHAHIERGEPYLVEYRLATVDKGVRWFCSIGQAEFGADGKALRMMGICQDITERKKNEESLELAMLAFNTSSESIMVTDADGIIVAVNPAFTTTTGFSAEEAIGKTPKILSSNCHDQAFYQAMWAEINRSGAWKGEIYNRRKDGEILVELLSINTVFNRDGQPWRRVGVFSDITDKKATEEVMWRHANIDSLTGLPNRRMFYERLGQEIKKTHRSGSRMALFFLDLDRFKEVNDTLGHGRGDLLLAQAAQRLQASVRETDTVARLGGDEFMVIIGDLDAVESLDRIAQAILEQLSQSYALNDETAYVSVSIGITVYPNDGKDIEQLIKNADQAMYAAKSQGRNRFCYFTQTMQLAADQRLQLSNDLREALADRQFAVYYQPIVELASGRVRKAEALIRWSHPKRGMVSPAQFIPIAEDTGLIHAIGDWVFQDAVKRLQSWRRSFDPQFQISVNKSPVQFRDVNVCGNGWTEQLRRVGLPGDGIVVEITEGLLLDALSSTRQKLLDFRDAGINVAIDDFGTGYSALAYLNKFDIDYLKIDQSFIRRLAQESNDLALCEAMVMMAHKLGLKVIAEGVETDEQRRLLIAIGCDFAQGYFFAKPLPVDQFEQFLNEALASDCGM